jgi:hypothetical protein
MLHGASSDDLDPAWILDDGRRNLMLTIDACRADGIFRPALYLDGAFNREETAFANAEVVAFNVVRADIWPNADDPRVELASCLDEATSPLLIDWYAGRIRDAWLRRQALERAEHLVRMAHAPTTDMEELARCLSA